MGQSASAGSYQNLELFTKRQIKQLFYTRCILVFQPLDIECLTRKLKLEKYSPETKITRLQLKSLLQFDDLIDSNSHLNSQIDDLYEMFKVLGNFPFYEDYYISEDELLAKHLIIAMTLLSCRYKKFCQNLDYLKMLFIALAFDAIPSNQGAEKDENIYSVEVTSSSEPEDTIETKCLKINWSSFELISKFANIDISELFILGDKVKKLITFSIIIDNIRLSAANNQELNELLVKWDQIDKHSNAILRYIDININLTKLSNTEIKFIEFSDAFKSFFKDIFINNFKYLFNSRLLNFRVPGSQKDDTNTKKNLFKESRIIDQATLAYLCTTINNTSTNERISRQNLVKLFTGSESGFSIRSIEQSIFKWRAPTVFIVRGKRLKSKTITSNKRYLEFDSEYPRFFKSLEVSLKSWQNANDTIMYAVLVCEPWKNSNKHNFGDENSIIYSLGPRFDYFESVHSPALDGKLIYFNSLGLGIGFGNDQPINKHGVKKYLPGDVSLTIEANLEFAFFRHLASPSSNTTSYFHKSNQQQVKSEDFEDRFIITDLEVWGIGSMKELDEQRRQWEWENKQAETRQSVNLRNLGEERAFLEMVGLVGNHGSGGSV